MDQLNGLFTQLGQALMPPVMIFLLAGLIIALLDAGDHVGERAVRWRARRRRAALEAALAAGSLEGLGVARLGGALGGALARWAVRPLEAGNIERALDELEDRFERTLQRTTALIRVGPALGLLGTLIPMGPALSDLAAGHIDAMATRLTLAFSTTVIGLTISLIATLVYLSRRRCYAEELRLGRTIAAMAHEALEREAGP